MEKKTEEKVIDLLEKITKWDYTLYYEGDLSICSCCGNYAFGFVKHADYYIVTKTKEILAEIKENKV